MNKGFLLLLGAFAFCLSLQQSFAATDDEQWETFKTDYNKTYTNATVEAERKANFLQNFKAVTEHNKKYKNYEVAFEMGINAFSDLTQEQFAKNYMYPPGQYEAPTQDASEKIIRLDEPLPKSVNWLNKGWLTAVHHQTSYCGSCYTFSSTGAIEAQYYNKHKKFIGLSRQELVDCSREFGNFGCNGGYLLRIFQYVKENGLGHSINHPYLARETQCYKTNPRIRIKNYHKIPYGNELELMKALHKYGPVPVDVDATQWGFVNYRKGIYYEPNCTTYNLSHSVLIVGYGVTKTGQSYWLIKNSWGPNWGDKGYMYMARTGNNLCGVASRAYYPIVE